MHFPVLVAAILSTILIGVVSQAAAADSLLPPPTPLEPLESSELCNRCAGTLLPGRVVPSPHSKWGIISDLPESFSGYGVLYSTRPVLPANGGAPALLEQRRGHGFQGIDNSFDVFLFHLNKSTTGSQRLVVYVQNEGQEPVTLAPGQVIKSEGIIGTVHEFESTLGARVLAEDWDRPLKQVSIPPGEGRVVAFGKQFGNGVTDGPDSSRNVNTFGYARVRVEETSGTPHLEVSVISIPAGEQSRMNEEAARYAQVGARSTDEVSLSGAPQGCALGRAVGVYPNFQWVGDPMVLEVTRLTESGTSFPMALPAIQTAGCERARQTHDLVLYPGYTRPETIGNYMIEHAAEWTLTNASDTTRSADLVFGKEAADIGLAYMVEVDRKPLQSGGAASNKSADGATTSGQVQTLWAGPKQSSREKSLLGGAMDVPPGQSRAVRLRFLILGNSSLPFFLGWKAE